VTAGPNSPAQPGPVNDSPACVPLRRAALSDAGSLGALRTQGVLRWPKGDIAPEDEDDLLTVGQVPPTVNIEKVVTRDSPMGWGKPDQVFQ
jgi:hypothetical protein